MSTISIPPFYDEVTDIGADQPAETSLELQIDHLVIVRKKRKIVLSFRPKEKNITLGRSRRNSIVLTDPTFPRQAGEIILGPVPHYRNINTASDMKPPKPMEPGKEYPFPPYFVRLMAPGDLLVIRKSTQKTSRHALIFFLLVIMLTAVEWNMEVLSFENSGSGKSSSKKGRVDEMAKELPTIKFESSTANENFHLETGEAIQKDQREHQYIELVKEAQTKDPISPQTIEDRVQKSTLPLPENESQRKHHTTNLIRPEGIKPDEFNELLSRIGGLIKDDNMDETIRLLNPVVPLTNDDQKLQIIEILDSYLDDLFRKAYTLKNLDRPECIRMLSKINACQIPFLPSWQKANKLLNHLTADSH